MSAAGVTMSPVREKHPTWEEVKATTILGPHCEEFLTRKVGNQEFVESTANGYRRVLARMCRMFPSIEPGDITVDHLDRVLYKSSPGSVGYDRAVLSSFWMWMRKRQRIRENPAELLDHPKKTKEIRVDTFSPAEVEALQNQRYLRDGVLMTLLFDTGMRISEARHLRLSHVSLEDGFVTIVKGKGGKGRIIPVGERTVRRVAELEMLDGIEKPDFLWYGFRAGSVKYGAARGLTRNDPIDNNRFYRWWKHCLDQVGVPYRRPHTSRHTYATDSLRHGVTLSELKRFMGHESIDTTDDLYGHLDMSDLKAAVRRRESNRMNAASGEGS